MHVNLLPQRLRVGIGYSTLSAGCISASNKGIVSFRELTIG